MKSTFKLLFFAVFAVLFSACTDEFRIERREDRIQGAWIFESASFRDNGDLFRENRDAEFVGDIIEFYRDYSALYDDRRERTTYEGNWELYLDRAGFDDDGDGEFFLDLDFFDDRNRPVISFLCEVNNLGWERMNLRANTRDGVYFFRLRRL